MFEKKLDKLRTKAEKHYRILESTRKQIDILVSAQEQLEKVMRNVSK